MRLTIFMEPVAKARARTVRNKYSGKSVTFTPDKTAHAENLIRDAVLSQINGFFEAGVPLRLEAIFYKSRPKARKKAVFPTVKPDWDNYAKLLTDAMRGILYEDDNQITTAVIRKRYALPGHSPRVEIELIEDEN